jgi:hypothetical protein
MGVHGLVLVVIEARIIGSAAAPGQATLSTPARFVTRPTAVLGLATGAVQGGAARRRGCVGMDAAIGRRGRGDPIITS